MFKQYFIGLNLCSKKLKKKTTTTSISEFCPINCSAASKDDILTTTKRKKGKNRVESKDSNHFFDTFEHKRQQLIERLKIKTAENLAQNNHKTKKKMNMKN